MDRKLIIEQFADSDDEFWESSSTNSSSSESSSSSLEIFFSKRRKLHRIKDFISNTVHQYDDEEFKEHFRLSRATCTFLIGQVREARVLPTHKFGRNKIDSEKALLITLWYLSNTETFRQIADRFDVTKSSAHRIVKKIIRYFVAVKKTYIKWPNLRRKHVIKNGFKNMHGIDGILGAIDGCHINIRKPIKDAHVYCNRKSQHSILMQGVCDHEKRFTDLLCGEAGSIHDARLLKRSSLYKKALEGFLGNDFILGDSAYPCLNWLIPPYKDNGRLTRNQRVFNYRHSSCRIVIENAFGLLKGRFRRLTHFENLDIVFIVECVVAAVVLHNICIDFGDEYDEEYLDNDDDEDEDEENIAHVSGISPVHTKRNELFHQMFTEE